MSSLYPQGWLSYLNILLVLLRLMGFFLLVPGFSHRAIPANVKTVLALSLALAVYPMVRSYLDPIPETIGGIALVALKETTIGFLMGFGAYLTFEGVNLGAQFVGYQMGFGTASLIDPQNQASVSVMVPLQSWMALMVFFFADLHHDLLRLFVMSFQVSHHATQTLTVSTSLLKVLVGLSGRLFVLAVQMAAPFTLLVLLSNAGLGILSRLMPQMNVMLFSFPITILLGFAALYCLAPDLLNYLESILGDISSQVMGILRAI